MFLYFVDFDNIENPIESEIPLREYQKELALDGCEGENVIIIAPTNSGKTWVACRIIQVRMFEPRCEKTGLRGFRPGPTQTRLYVYNHKIWLEGRNFVFR